MGNIEVTQETFYKIFEEAEPQQTVENEVKNTYIYNDGQQIGLKVWNHASSKLHQYYLLDINL